jgi:hypothetical protein
MKLVDLHPTWIGAGGDGVFKADGSPAPARTGVAIWFDCPCGKPDDFVCVEVDPPLDGGPPTRDAQHRWQRTGDSFDVMTLSPSIRKIGGCNWHGLVIKGEVTTLPDSGKAV